MNAPRLTKAAELDIEQILRDTKRSFGGRQKNIYRDIIKQGVRMVAAEPERGGSRGRDDLAPKLRSFHLELAAGRLGAAAHCLHYTTEMLGDGSSRVVILRVLHERMEPRLYVARAMHRPLDEGSADDPAG